jgi:outer membrane protein, multidrug efflux system
MKNSLKKALARSVSWISMGLTVIILTGCASVGPNYVPPKTSVSTDWNAQLKGGLTAQEMDPQTLAAWWTTLDDPALSRLIERAAFGNLDVKKARARIREARARRGIAQADRFPTLDAKGSAVASRSSEEIGTGKTSELYTAGIDAAWELDIFGGVRRSVEAAEADLGATKEGLRDTLVSLLAEVALNYIEVRTFQARLTVAEANLAAQSETYQLTLWRFEAGLSDELAVEQGRYNLENTRSQIPTLRTGMEKAMNRIAVLLGEQLGMVNKELKQYKPIPVTPVTVAIGVPAEVLRRRPDVRKAERELAAQTARIGVATAELYPKFKLSGSIGLESLAFGSLVSWASRTLSGGSSISWPIFDASAIRQNIEVQSALQEQYLIAYEATVLSTLEEVENALVAYAEEQNRRHSLTETTQAAQRAVDLAQFKYQTGLADFSNVLDAQRSLLSFQDQLAQSEGTITSNLVRLYKALGGGWTSLAAEETK